MPRDFHQIEWDDATAEDCRHIVRLAIREDLEREQDWTTWRCVPQDRVGAADVVARQPGIVAGIPALALAIEEFGACALAGDNRRRRPGDRRGRHGRAHRRRTCATCSPASGVLLNLLGRLMGIATLTHEYVACTAGTDCRVYDTRKTTPGWRRLEKYAVRCGGGHNHRTGLYDAILIKDNHLAQLAGVDRSPAAAAEAVPPARQFLRDYSGERRSPRSASSKSKSTRSSNSRRCSPSVPTSCCSTT